MFTSLLVYSLMFLLPLGRSSLPLVINTWPFKNAASSGKTFFPEEIQIHLDLNLLQQPTKTHYAGHNYL